MSAAMKLADLLQRKMRARDDGLGRPRLGVVAYGPIQYHTPLFQLLAKRGHVELDVLFLRDSGLRLSHDLEFGLQIAWDIDLLSGYDHQFLATASRPQSRLARIRTLARWITPHEAVVVNGYSSGWMLLTMLLCRLQGVPYLLRASSHPRGASDGPRRVLRHLVAGAVVRASAGGLVMGRLNEEFYSRNHARLTSFAPNSVDHGRFAASPAISRTELLARWDLPTTKPVILFSGKLIPRKRPLDIIAAVKLLEQEVTVLFVGDGALAGQVRAALDPAGGVVTGFVNQTLMPAYYHAADVLVLPSEAETWGLAVNEAMAAGVLPVVSDAVGCVPDLVTGVGEVFRCADVADLAAALRRALARINDPACRAQMRHHAARYSLDGTAEGFEQAATAVGVRGLHHSSRTTARDA
jgi:glycosyltransferase involved in cell wall biosynthesis